jgi:hypothetical protein
MTLSCIGAYDCSRLQLNSSGVIDEGDGIFQVDSSESEQDEILSVFELSDLTVARVMQTLLIILDAKTTFLH